MGAFTPKLRVLRFKTANKKICFSFSILSKLRNKTSGQYSNSSFLSYLGRGDTSMEAIDTQPPASPMVTQSRFFTSDFNAAIIDGPLRIYFADRQESEALRIYFDIQETLMQTGMRLDSLPLDIPNMYLMLYPTKKSYSEVFEKAEDLASEQFGEHLIMGIQGDNSPEISSDDRLELISQRVKSVFQAWPIIK
jgi:hypothetical protein